MSKRDIKNLKNGQHGLHFAVVELTDKCNLRCKHCYGDFVGSKILNIKEATIIVNQLKEAGCWRVTLSGGEPFVLGGDLSKMVELFRSNFNKLILVTNGTLIKKEYYTFLKNIDLVQVSLDGPSEIHDFIRGKGVFNKAINSIKWLKKNNINTVIMFTANKININSFLPTIKIADNLGVKMFFERYTPKNKNDELSITNKEFFKISKVALLYNIESSDPIYNLYKNISKNNDKFLLSPMFSGCSAGISGIAITADLDVLPCVRIRKSIGNLHLESLLNIWYNNSVLRMLRDLSLYGGKCGPCGYLKKCRGCRAEAIVKYNDILKDDDLCFLK